jgi:hypothetical protein
VQPTLGGEAARQRQDEIDLRARHAHHAAEARSSAPRRALVAVVAIAAMLALAAAAALAGGTTISTANASAGTFWASPGVR